MRLFCEVYIRYVLPALRAMISEVLIRKYSLTQCEVSKMLGITQPAINQYLSGKRGYKVVKVLRSSGKMVKLAEDVAEKIVKERPDPKEIAKMLCASCALIRSDEELLNDLLSKLRIGHSELILTDCTAWLPNGGSKEALSNIKCRRSS